MKVTKVINNNFVCSCNEKNKEIIVMGKGIGFKAKEGDQIDSSKVEKVFTMNGKSAIDKFKRLIEELPIEHFKVSNDIINYAKRTLGKRLNQNIYITLTDHISFSVYRFEHGMKFKNPLLWEVKHFYSPEYIIGEYAVNLIKEKLNVDMGDDEAANIALHIVNAEYNTEMNDALKITTLIGDILKIVTDTFDIQLDEESLHYSRLITHLKFLSQRIFMGEMLKDSDDVFAEIIATKYPKEYRCALKIRDYIEKQYNQRISNEELVYLTVHIRRVSSIEDEN